MKFRHLYFVVGGVSVLLSGQAFAQSAASCRKAEFRGGAPVFFYDKACMAKLKPAKKAVGKKSVRVRAPSPKVRRVQKLLAAKGYKPGAADGVMGGNTKKAIAQYYKRHGLKGSRMNAVLAHLKSSPKSKKAAAKRARIAAIKKAVAAKRAAAAKTKAASTAKTATTSPGASKAADARKARVAGIKKAVAAKRAAAKKQAAASTAKTATTSSGASKAADARKARVAAIKKAVAAKRAAAKKQAASSTTKIAAMSSGASKAADARKARVAAIKKAVAAKRTAAAKTKSAAAKPSFLQRMKKKVASAVYGKKSKDTASNKKVAAAKRDRVAAIKKAVAAKRAAAKTAAKPKVAAPQKQASSNDAAARKARVAAIKKAVAAKRAAAKTVAKPKAAAPKKQASSNDAAARKARVAAIKKAVAAKRAAAAKTATKPKATASVAKTASKGDKNVADLQTLLAGKGKYAGKVDGTMNIETRKSVINYYSANKLDVGNGTIAQAVHKHLKSGGATKTVATAAPVKVKPKSSGNKVVDIQSMLAEKGLYSGKASGLLDAPTRKSILGYYKKHKLKRNGRTIIETVHSHLSGGTA